MSPLTRCVLLGAACAFALVWPQLASAEDCPRGDLDERFCDADGDLIADIPTDESQLVDPDQLIFAYTPVEDPRGVSRGMGRLPDPFGRGHGQDVGVFPRAEQRRANRGLSVRPPSHCGI